MAQKRISSILCVTVAAGLASGLGAWAQDAPPASPPAGLPSGSPSGSTGTAQPANVDPLSKAPGATMADPWRVTAADHLARTLVRLALLDLRITSSPDESDYRAASIMLGFARELSPKDVELLRRQAEAAYNSGDEEQALDLTRQIVSLDPADTVAQLRLITALIGRNSQNADERLKLYERYLQETRLDASVRSRLALDAALLRRENGDESGFLKLLAQATSLDSTHKEAAAVAAAYIADRRTDPLERFDALTNLLKADPLDPNVHMTLARELAFSGAFRSARRFHNIGAGLLSLSGGSTVNISREMQALRWHTNGPAATVAAINAEITQARADAQREIDKAIKRKRSTDNLKKPSEIGIEPESSRLLLLAAESAGDEAMLKGTFDNLVTRMAEDISILQDPLKRGNIGEAEAQAAIIRSAIFLQTTRVVSGIQVDEAERDLANSPGLVAAVPEGIRGLQAWILLRRGRAQEALEILAENRDILPLNEFGYARALDALGRKDEAIAAYVAITRKYPLDAYGCWARTRAFQLGYKEDRTLADALERRADAIPQWIDRLAIDPSSYVRMTAQTLSENGETLDRFPIRITLQNMCPLPMSLGADRSINSRFGLMAKVEARGIGLDRFTQPEVVDLDRRLRLNPREAVVVDVWPDAGLVGWAAEALANRTTRVRWRVIQGFVLNQYGVYSPGMFCQEFETPATQRRPLAESTVPSSQLAAKVAADPISALHRLAAVVRGHVIQPLLLPNWEPPEKAIVNPVAVALDAPPEETEIKTGVPPTAEEMRAIGESFAKRYTQLNVTERAHILAILPHARLAPGLESLDALAKQEQDPMLVAITLVTRIADANDPVLKAASEHTDERVRALAAAVTRRLQSGEPSYATLTPETLIKSVQRFSPLLGDENKREPSPAAVETLPATPTPGPSGSSAPDVNK